MEIQRADVSYAERILELQKTSYKSEAELYHDYSIPPMTQTLQEIKDDFSYKTFLKVTEDDKILGSVRAFEKDGTCYIGRLMVHPDFQNRGIGKNLMQEIENLFDTCKRFELFAGSKSKKNIILYEKLGYNTFKTEKITEDVSLVYMEKIKK